MKRLPIGIQSFERIIEEDYLYIDKTKQIHQLVTSGGYFFLSRPRRFGKSLTLSTVQALYEGKKELFKGLWIENKWNWAKTHPVIHISFNAIGYKTLGLEQALYDILTEIAQKNNIQLFKEAYDQRFRELIEKMGQLQKVVLLLDEYDKALIDYLTKDKLPTGLKNQEIFKNFYSVIKSSDPYLELVLITGVSKFSKVSLFSDLNNLFDLSLDWRFADLVGYTQKEIVQNFKPYFPLAKKRNRLRTNKQLLEKVKYWYNGYSWDAETFVYNPFSILCFFTTGEFRNYWFETGTPTFLIDTLNEQTYYQYDNQYVTESSFSAFNIAHLDALPLLFQTGYLTIKAKKQLQYLLDYPNFEVKSALFQYILGDLSHQQPGLVANIITKLEDAFNENDIEEVVDILISVFANIPYQIFIANLEAYYHSLLYIIFSFLNLYDVQSEVSTNKGRIDTVVETTTHIYLLEFKLDKSANSAIQQIKQLGYPEKYQQKDKILVLVGIAFSKEEKTIIDWKIE